jgi:hypothetical protein
VYSSVTTMFQRLGWRSLDARLTTRLTMIYKTDRELVAIPKTDRLVKSRPSRRNRHTHTHTYERAYQIQHNKIYTRKMSFFPITVRVRNALTQDVTSLDILEAFKARTSLAWTH